MLSELASWARMLLFVKVAIGTGLLVGLLVSGCARRPEPAMKLQSVTEPAAGQGSGAEAKLAVQERPERQPGDEAARTAKREQTAQEPDRYAEARRRMVETQLKARDITDPRVLDAMARVPRHLFVPESLRDEAYNDYPLPIGHSQTISQPYIVALMTQLVRPTKDSIALDVGTGSGYQAAVLAELCKEVYSIEIIKELADSAAKRLAELGYKNVQVRCGDGYRGWPEKAPFDVIIVAAAPDHVPEPLVNQLAPGGRMVLPVGRWYQELVLIEKDDEGNVTKRTIAPVAFVPMTGEAQRRKGD